MRQQYGKVLQNVWWLHIIFFQYLFLISLFKNSWDYEMNKMYKHENMQICRSQIPCYVYEGVYTVFTILILPWKSAYMTALIYSRQNSVRAVFKGMHCDKCWEKKMLIQCQWWSFTVCFLWMTCCDGCDKYVLSSQGRPLFGSMNVAIRCTIVFIIWCKFWATAQHALHSRMIFQNTFPTPKGNVQIKQTQCI